MEWIARKTLIACTRIWCGNYGFCERCRDVCFGHLRDVIAFMGQRHHIESLLSTNRASGATRTENAYELSVRTRTRVNVRDSFDTTRIGEITSGT